MKNFCVSYLSLTCLFLLALLRTITYNTHAEKIENITIQDKLDYIHNRLLTAIFSLKDNSSKVQKYDPLIQKDPIVVTGSAAVIHNRTRFFDDILASARNPNENEYNNGIRYLGVENFLSAAVQFCADESQGEDLDIVSVGSDDGYVEKNILRAYEERFGNNSHLRIILIDPDTRCRNRVHFKYVDDLIREYRRIVGNCVLFIFCPEPGAINEGYDIDSIRKLEPKAVLAQYDATGKSGSKNFIKFLDPDGLRYGEQFWRKRGLNYYPVKEILLQVKWMSMDIRLTKVKK